MATLAAGNNSHASNHIRRGGILCKRTVAEGLRACQDALHTRRTERVSFALVEIREYPVLLGDNPGGVAGPPLALDWEIQAEHTMSLDEYEHGRPPRRRERQLILPISRRIEILREWGYSRQDILRGTKPVNIARRRRKVSIQSMRLDGIQEVLERVNRGALRVLTFGVRKRSDRKFISKCLNLDSAEFEEMYLTVPLAEEDLSSGGGYSPSVDAA